MKINNKILYLIFIIIIVAIVSAIIFYFVSGPKTTEIKTDGIMILIESKSEPIGLSTMVTEMKEKNIYGLLMVSPEFVQTNCEEVKNTLSLGNIEIVAANVQEPFWDILYEDQKARIVKMLDEIEGCTGTRPRIISSRYMASDMTTIQVAEDLGIPYITARGTTGDKATVYQPEGYNVKILSVSNIPLVTFEYGSLCDYSFYERAGTPNDMREELTRAIELLTPKEKAWFGQYSRVTPVSHTYIGGNLKQWNDMWVEFWDNANINWVSLDEFMEKPDWTIPLWQIPTNKNNPYTQEKIRPLTPYEQEEKVINICN